MLPTALDRIEELEASLIKERAKSIRIRKYLLSEKIEPGDPRFCPEDEDEFDHHIAHAHEDQQKAEQAAREQLQTEGKL